MADTLLKTDHGAWVELTLNRPGKMNAINEAMGAALLAALNDARQSSARAVLITGAGRGFCTGQDLGDKNPKDGPPPDLGKTLRTIYNPIIRAIRDLPAPVVCAVNGPAAGAGASIALACDITLAADGATFVLPFARIGLVPGAGSSWTLVRAVGEARAKAMALTAEPVLATTAADWGLIWKAVPADALVSEARTLTARLAAGPSFGLSQTKKAIQQAAHNTLDQHLDLEAALQTLCGQHPDFAEGVAAFMEKRQPVFAGVKP